MTNKQVEEQKTKPKRGFALAAAPIGTNLGFGGVLWFAAGCQLLSYLVIRVWVREGR